MYLCSCEHFYQCLRSCTLCQHGRSCPSAYQPIRPHTAGSAGADLHVHVHTKERGLGVQVQSGRLFTGVEQELLCL